MDKAVESGKPLETLEPLPVQDSAFGTEYKVTEVGWEETESGVRVPWLRVEGEEVSGKYQAHADMEHWVGVMLKHLTSHPDLLPVNICVYYTYQNGEEKFNWEQRL